MKNSKNSILDDENLSQSIKIGKKKFYNAQKILFLAILILSLIIYSSIVNAVYHALIAMPVVVFFGFFAVNVWTNYYEFYKNDFIRNIVKSLDENFEYIHKKEHIENEKTPEFGLFFRYDGSNFNKEDFISGIYKGVEFEFCEYNFIGLNTEFYAQFLTCNFYKDFKSNLKILNKKIKFWQLGKAKKFDNVEFNKMFKIIADDEVEARYLLSPSFMEKLCKLNANGNFGFVSAAFKDNKFYLFFENNKNLFEPHLFFKKPSVKIAEFYKSEILEILSVIDELNLTLNIYPKTVLKNQKLTR